MSQDVVDENTPRASVGVSLGFRGVCGEEDVGTGLWRQRLSYIDQLWTSRLPLNSL
jgi:hypothetical protein